jgi:Asp-tRNA(Asn)/Glu-tRNA(Gln) amidotransferase A subunit family amidase
VFTKLYAESAMARRGVEALRSVGLRARPLDGLTVSIKDLFDAAGETTGQGQ